MELEWPIEGLEPMSFVLTRLLEPLSIRLERRDRGVAVLHVQLRLVAGDVHARSLQLPSPMRDVRTLRTLALLDLESHPPSAAIDRVTIVIDPTPGRVVQHTLFARPQLTPEQLSTLLARLGAVMGQDRIGAPATVDSYRPGAFVMKAFAPGHEPRAPVTSPSRVRATSHEPRAPSLEPEPSRVRPAPSPAPRASVLRRCRQPVPGRVAADAIGRPVRVTTDRRGFAGGTVVRASARGERRGNGGIAQAAMGSRRMGRHAQRRRRVSHVHGPRHGRLVHRRHLRLNRNHQLTVHNHQFTKSPVHFVTPSRGHIRVRRASRVVRVQFSPGASLPEALVERAAELGYPALALLDRDGVYGAPRFHKAALAAGLRPIIGAELTIAGAGQAGEAGGAGRDGSVPLDPPFQPSCLSCFPSSAKPRRAIATSAG